MSKQRLQTTVEELEYLPTLLNSSSKKDRKYAEKLLTNIQKIRKEVNFESIDFYEDSISAKFSEYFDLIDNREYQKAKALAQEWSHKIL